MKSLFQRKILKRSQYLIGLVLICVVSGVLYSLSGIIGYKVVAYILLVTLSVLALFFDIVPVVLSAVLSALIWDFFFIPPRFMFIVDSTEDAFLLVMYFVIVLLHAVLTYKIRQIQKVAQQREERASTLKLYSTLLNSLSHELRTPIATIIGASDNLMMSDGKLSKENRESLVSEISVAALRLNQQVENLLNMSRLESGFVELKKDWCDLNELVYRSTNHLGDSLSHHVLDIQIPETMPMVKLDEGLMEQVLYNLLLNAVNYTPGGSTITVKGRYSDGNCIITIEDDGKGFPPDEIGRAFDKFYRLRRTQTGGTGLGLSIAKGFVEAHEGTIQLENAPLGGALFTITIPTQTASLNAVKNE